MLVSRFAISVVLAFLAVTQVIHANDSISTMRLCLERVRTKIGADTKLCAMKSGSFAVGFEDAPAGETNAPVMNCAAKDQALAMATAECRKESQIEQAQVAVTEAPKAKKKDASDDVSAPFIDDGSKYKAPASQIDMINSKRVASAKVTSKATTIVKKATPVEEDDEEEAPVAKKKTTAATTPKKTTPAVTNDDEEEAAPTTAKATKAKKATPTEEAVDPADKPTTQKEAKTPTQQQQQPASTPRQSSRSSVNVDADLAQCQQSQSKAQQCCNNPSSCLTATDRSKYNTLVNGGDDESSGLTDACERLQKASSMSGDLNGKVAALCTNNQYACQNVCAGLVSKYQGLIDSCDECEEYSTYQDALYTLQSKQNSCSNLVARADALSIQSLSSGSDQGLAAACQQQGGATPSAASASSSPGGEPNFGQAGATSAPGGYGGSNAVASSAGFSAPQGAAGGSAGFSYGNSNNEGAAGNPNYGQGSPSSPPSVRGVPNGGGGFGGGGGGGGSPGAQAGGPPRPSPGSPGFSTDIDQGYRSGGYSASGGPGPTDQERRAGRGLASAGPDSGGGSGSGLEGVDLKQYLPGGAKYRASGLNAGARSEINAKEEDIWRRISNKYVEKCKLGTLYRCQE